MTIHFDPHTLSIDALKTMGFEFPTFQDTGVNALGLRQTEAETRVVVAMSGGVDSSVVAGLLHVLGFEVIGVTLQLYDYGEAVQRKGACCAGQDIYDAKRVAEQLGFRHYVLNYEDRFRQDVIEDFADSYLKGETPIPCVSCNQSVKFRDLFKVARDLGGDCLATGHYVSSRLLDSGHYGLFRPIDDARDQTYFLFATTQEQLDYLRFPLGRLHKSQTRELAERLGLEIASKPDSQDICFVPNGHYSDVVKKLRPEALNAGDIVHLDGRVLGRHEGIIHYTIGQRRGLGVATGEPLFVVTLDAEAHRVIVGPREALFKRDVYLKDLNWLGDGDVQTFIEGPEGGRLYAKLRSTQGPQAAQLCCEDGVFFVRLDAGEEGVSPGQAAVLYDGMDDTARTLGGGFISHTA